MTPSSLADILPAAVAEHPDAEAVRSGPDSLTYAVLGQRCDAIAARLRDLGVAPGDLVGVWVHKSVDSMAAVHAVLGLGAAYVPLDPGASAPILARTATDAGLSVIATNTVSRRVCQLLDELPQIRLLHLGEVSDDDRDVAADIGAADPDARAYVIYTSGSTGEPKGIVHTHRSALAYAARARRLYELGSDDLLANIAPLHFDQSTFELFSGPLAGATSLFVPEPYLRLPASLSQLIEDEHPTVWYSVPSVLQMLAERGALDQRDLSSLRWVLFGGEAMAPDLLRELMDRCPDARFSNVYGPAEVNQCMYHHFDEPPATGAPIPLGVAWDGTELAIVDDELLVRTDTIMAGYLHRPDLTDAAFVTGPDGRRDWYATGDLVERLPTGDLVFVGRRDNQVKVRGHRVELEAVDAAAARLDGVSEAVAIVCEGPDGLPVVEAFVTLSNGRSELDADAIRRLGAQLPPHAVPHRLRVVDSLPRTSTGKIDRAAVGRDGGEPCRS